MPHLRQVGSWLLTQAQRNHSVIALGHLLYCQFVLFPNFPSASQLCISIAPPSFKGEAVWRLGEGQPNLHWHFEAGWPLFGLAILPVLFYKSDLSPPKFLWCICIMPSLLEGEVAWGPSKGQPSMQWHALCLIEASWSLLRLAHMDWEIDASIYCEPTWHDKAANIFKRHKYCICHFVAHKCNKFAMQGIY